MDGSVAAVSGPVRRAALAVLLLTLLAAGCAGGERAGAGGERAGTGRSPAAAAFNETDVMFLQMSLAQIAEGDKVAAIAERSAARPEIKAVAGELRAQWSTESGTMQRWLLGWERPLTADPSAGQHAGHGDLHSVRAEDLAALRSAEGADLDRTAVALLLGNLHNGMETLRMEVAGGSYPPARSLAETMSATRQGQIQRLLALAAG